jgi:hypothetical protein
MIGKKIKPRKSRSRSENISGMAEYVLGIDEDAKPGKVPYIGAYNCDEAWIKILGLSWESRELLVNEMLELAAAAKRSENPCNHYMISWKAFEKPTNEQIDAAVKIVLETLGLSKCKTIYGKHVDTDDIHVHILINRVDPETKLVKRIGSTRTPDGKEIRGRALDKLELLKAVAKIEHEQQWQPEEKAVYRIMENGKMGHRSISQTGEITYRDLGENVERPRGPRKSQAAADMEAHRQSKSAETIAMEKGFDKAIREAKTWEELQAKLNEIGGTFYIKGSGAVIMVEKVQEPIKCSSLGRDCSYKALEKRFGEKAPEKYNNFPKDYKTKDSQEPKKEVPVGLAPSQTKNWKAYNEADRSLRKDQSARRSELTEKHRQERGGIFKVAEAKMAEAMKSPDWKAQRSIVAYEREVALLYLRDKQKEESKSLTKVFQQERAGLDHLRPHPPEWKNKKTILKLSDPSAASSPPEPSRLPDLRDYIPKKLGPDVHYTQDKPIQRTAFIDSGHSISVLGRADSDILAALQLAKSRWGKNVVVSGTQKFVNRAIAIALAYGINLTNPEYQAAKAALDTQKAAAAQAKEAAPLVLDKTARDKILSEVSKAIQGPDGKDLQKVAKKIYAAVWPYRRGGDDPDNPKGLLALSQKELNYFSLDISKATGVLVSASTIQKIVARFENENNTPEMLAKVAERRQTGKPNTQQRGYSGPSLT